MKTKYLFYGFAILSVIGLVYSELIYLGVIENFPSTAHAPVKTSFGATCLVAGYFLPQNERFLKMYGIFLYIAGTLMFISGLIKTISDLKYMAL